jgi:hypothetical protein
MKYSLPTRFSMDLSKTGNAATVWTPCDHAQVDTIITQFHVQISDGPRHGISRLSGEYPGSQPMVQISTVDDLAGAGGGGFNQDE